MGHASATEWLLSVNSQGKIHTIPLGTQATCFGRSTSADVRLVSSGVSRRHAEVGLGKDGCPQVTDLESHNGTIVNRDKLAGTRKLKAGDRIRIAHWKFIVEQRTSPAGNGGRNGERHILVLGTLPKSTLPHAEPENTNSKSRTSQTSTAAGSDPEIIPIGELGDGSSAGGSSAIEPALPQTPQDSAPPASPMPNPPSPPPEPEAANDDDEEEDIITLDFPDDAPMEIPEEVSHEVSEDVSEEMPDQAHDEVLDETPDEVDISFEAPPAPDALPQAAAAAPPVEQPHQPPSPNVIQPAPATLLAARKMMEAAQRRKDAQAGTPAAAETPAAVEPIRAPAATPAPAVAQAPATEVATEVAAEETAQEPPRQSTQMIPPALATLAAARKMMEAAQRRKDTQAGTPATVETSATAPLPASPPPPAPAVITARPSPPPVVELPAAEKPRQVIKVIQPAAATLAAAQKLMEAAQRNKAAGINAPLRVVSPSENELAPATHTPNPAANDAEANLPAPHAKARDISTVNGQTAPEISAATLGAVQAFGMRQGKIADAVQRRQALCDFAVGTLFPANAAAILRIKDGAFDAFETQTSSLQGAALHPDANLLAAAAERQTAVVAWDTCLESGAPAVAVCCPLSDGEYLYAATVLDNAKNNWPILLAQAVFMERLIRQMRGDEGE